MTLPDRTPLAGRDVNGGGDDASFVGRGILWPMQVDHTGSIAMSTRSGDIDRSIRVVLSTAPSERVMRPFFGCEIWDLLFEPVTDGLFAVMASAVRRAVDRWEPRVTVENVVVTADPNDAALVNIAVSYRVRVTNDTRNLVFPFYVIPREES